ncbi:MAG: hypothetical protein M1833_003256 [Piccolia ochrophora]|nr:MAG: hypothetical protein M1833_003256 [Piccolia ochrophora]
MSAAGKSAHSQGHTTSSKLEDQAATAALYVTKGRSKKSSDNYPLDEHGKLSEASAATSLKHADSHDLPSFPVVGLSNKESSAGAAASLAHANQKPFEHWKPDPSASASAAAVLAKDHKAPEPWHPEETSKGSKAAASHAQAEGGFVDVWRPGNAITAYGNSAAAQAIRLSGVVSPEARSSTPADDKKKSLIAATGAVKNSRRRAESTPVPVTSYPDAGNSSANALNAATLAAKPSTKKAAPKPGSDPRMPPIDAARIHNIAKNKVNRDMYGSHPPVALEIEEKNRNDVLHAAAVSMAKKMFEAQQRKLQEASAVKRSDSRAAATSVHGRQHRRSSVSSDESSPAPMQFTSVEDAAKKLAAERLAKLHDEHRAYRDYYGTNAPARHTSMRMKMRRRASSEGGNKEEDDEAQSRRIRSEMSIFNRSLAEVDMKKRQRDRDALMAAAQRNVKASMSGMDEKVFAETGNVAPSLMEDWEAKARAKAEAGSKARMANYGKVNIGGGKFMDQADVDAVASKNVQPFIDDINLKAEAQRAKEEEIRLDQEQSKRLADEDKARQREIKADQKKAKDLEKQEEKARKQEEKTKKAEEKRRAKEEKDRTKDVAAPAAAVVATASQVPRTPQTPEPAEERPTTPTPGTTRKISVSSISSAPPEGGAVVSTTVIHPATIEVDPATSAQTPTSPVTSPTSPKSKDKVKSWFAARKDRLSIRRNSKTSPAADEPGAIAKAASSASSSSTSLSDISSDEEDAPVAATTDAETPSSPTKPTPKEKAKTAAKSTKAKLSSLLPGHRDSAATASSDSPSAAKASLDDARDDSMREVAMAGRSRSASPPGIAGALRDRSPSVSPVSSIHAAKDSDDDKKKKKKKAKADDDDEARDTVEENLLPPGTLGGWRRAESPVRDSKFVEQL